MSYLVSKVKKDRKMLGISVDGKEHKFGKSGDSFTIEDSGVANEIAQTHGVKGDKSVIVSEIPKTKREGVNKYHHSLRNLGNWKDRIDWSK